MGVRRKEGRRTERKIVRNNLFVDNNRTQDGKINFPTESPTRQIRANLQQTDLAYFPQTQILTNLTETTSFNIHV